MPQPPASSIAAWGSYVRDHDIPWTDLNMAGEALAAFWRPLLVAEEGSDATHWWADGWS